MLSSPEWERTPEQRKVCQALEQVAKEVGASDITSGTPLTCSHLTPCA